MMEKRISGTTRLLALFGSPIGHSGSPALYNFSYAHDGLDFVYLAFDIKADQMKDALNSMRLLNMKGGNVTMPCKNIAAGLVDELSPAACLVGAINTIVNKDSKLIGHITDGVGLIRSLEMEGVEVNGKKIVLLGAGGAGTAIQVQCALDGAKKISIFNTKDSFFAKAEETKNKLLKEAPNCEIGIYELANQDKLMLEIASADILINSTPVGMKPNMGISLVDKRMLRRDLAVFDTIYNPEKTQLILDAEEAGCLAIGGRSMLLWQAVESYKLCTGLDMPIDALRKYQEGNLSRN